LVAGRYLNMDFSSPHVRGASATAQSLPLIVEMTPSAQ
jgi:hypothetical protein